jgi:hypothetical protein
VRSSNTSLPAVSLTEALSLYTAQLEADGRSPHTVAQAGRHGALFARWLATAGESDDVASIVTARVIWSTCSSAQAGPLRG